MLFALYPRYCMPGQDVSCWKRKAPGKEETVALSENTMPVRIVAISKIVMPQNSAGGMDNPGSQRACCESIQPWRMRNYWVLG